VLVSGSAGADSVMMCWSVAVLEQREFLSYIRVLVCVEKNTRNCIQYFLTLVLFTVCTGCSVRCVVCIAVSCVVCIVVSCVVFIVVSLIVYIVVVVCGVVVLCVLL